MATKIPALFLILLSPMLLTGTALAAGLEIGKAGENFTYDDDGKEGSFQGLLTSDGTKGVVVAVTSYTCPYALRADEELAPLAAELAEKGVRVLAIYPNRHETAEGVRSRAKAKEFTHRATRDPQGKVSRTLGAEVTPTFFLFDATGILRYRGNLLELTVAVDAVLAGEDVASASTSATGCTVKWPDGKLPAEPVAPRPEVPGRQPRPGPDRPDQPGRGPPPGTPRDAPRTGPGGARPDGERRAPPPLSEAAAAWLATLLDKLDSEDPAVVRSVYMGIQGLGPSTLPYLERARRGEEGAKAQMLDRIMQQMRSGRRPGDRPGRPDARPGARGGRRFSFLDFQVRMIEENLDLSEEQRQAIKDALGPLKEREAELLRKRDSGADREAIRAEAGALMEDARKALSGILTPEQREKLEELRGRRMREGGRGPGGRRRPDEGGDRDR